MKANVASVRNVKLGVAVGTEVKSVHLGVGSSDNDVAEGVRRPEGLEPPEPERQVHLL